TVGRYPRQDRSHSNCCSSQPAGQPVRKFSAQQAVDSKRCERQNQNEYGEMKTHGQYFILSTSSTSIERMFLYRFINMAMATAASAAAMAMMKMAKKCPES